MNPARRGSLIAATWLIGLGVVFLAREATGLSWGEAWPMFVILGGVGAFVSTAVGGRSGIAPNRVEIDVQGGVGSVRVVSGA